MDSSSLRQLGIELGTEYKRMRIKLQATTESHRELVGVFEHCDCLRPLDPRTVGRLSGNVKSSSYFESAGVLAVLCPGTNMAVNWAQ